MRSSSSSSSSNSSILMMLSLWTKSQFRKSETIGRIKITFSLKKQTINVIANEYSGMQCHHARVRSCRACCW